MVASRVANTRLPVQTSKHDGDNGEDVTVARYTGSLALCMPFQIRPGGSQCRYNLWVVVGRSSNSDHRWLATKYAPTHHRLRPNVRSDVSPAQLDWLAALRRWRLPCLLPRPRPRLTPRERCQGKGRRRARPRARGLPADPGCPRPPDPTARTCRANPIPIRRGSFLGARRSAPAPIRVSPARTEREGKRRRGWADPAGERILTRNSCRLSCSDLRWLNLKLHLGK
jgi:hypothetical protein